MKPHYAPLAAVLLVSSCLSSHSQNIDRGSEEFTDLHEGRGWTFDGTFLLEIGAIADGFVTEERDVTRWLAERRLFDMAASDSPIFDGLSAYLWVRKVKPTADAGKWFLTHADNLPLLSASPDTRDNVPPRKATLADLNESSTPVGDWGIGFTDQNDSFAAAGSGVFSGSETALGNISSSQRTFTLVPEPSCVIMATLAACGMVLRRRPAC